MDITRIYKDVLQSIPLPLKTILTKAKGGIVVVYTVVVNYVTYTILTAKALI